MKTSVLLFLFAASSLSAQTEKEAKQLFYASHTRKELKIAKSEFKSIYKQAKCLSKEYKIPLKKMAIFQRERSTDFIDNGRYRQSIFNLGDTLFPKETDTGKPTKTCGAFTTAQ